MFLLSLLTFWIISKVFKALSEGHWTSVSSTHEKKLDARFMLWETLILNWAGKGAKGLQLQKEAGVAGGQRDPPSPCITFPLSGSCDGPFPTLHTIVIAYLHILILSVLTRSLWGLTNHGNQVYLCDKEDRGFSVFVGIAWVMAVLFFIYLCTVTVLFLCSTFKTFLLKKILKRTIPIRDWLYHSKK